CFPERSPHGSVVPDHLQRHIALFIFGPAIDGSCVILTHSNHDRRAFPDGIFAIINPEAIVAGSANSFFPYCLAVLGSTPIASEMPRGLIAFHRIRLHGWILHQVLPEPRT